MKKETNKDKVMVYSAPLQWLFIALIVPLMIGCSSSHTQRQEAVRQSFGTNKYVEVKATSYIDQFIVRCEDGSIWEVKASTETDRIGNVEVLYKNCLFDALYRLPPKPLAPPLSPLPLEKEDTNSTPTVLFLSKDL